MIFPSSRLLWAVLALAAIAIAVSIFPEYQAPWPLLAAGALLLALLDAFAGLRLAAPALARRVPGSLALGVRSEVRLRVANATGMRVRFELHDHHPATFEIEGLPRRLELPRGQWTEVAYQVRPVARGETQFDPAAVRLYSPLGLWLITRHTGEKST